MATLFRSSRAERELSREVDAHLQLLEDEHVAQGMSRQDARYAARRTFGGVEQAKEQQRDARSFRWLAGWPMDLKLGARMLIKSPGLTIIGVIALAVAIGAGAAFFELTNDLLEPTLDVPGADRIVGVTAYNAERRRDEMHRLRTFDTWRESAQSLDEMGAARDIERDLRTADGRTEPVRAVEISASAFRLMQTPPMMGRTLTDDDARPAAPPVTVIGHEVWRERYDASPDVLGMPARLGSIEYTIVGVMPAGFGFPIYHDMWVPLKRLPDSASVRQVFGRLRDGVTVAAAEAELAGIAAPELKAMPDSARTQIRVRPYLESIMDEDRDSFEVLAFRSLNVVFILLLCICGANVATLVFARTAMREAEITVRTALGASRGRISAQLFAEALVLSSLSAVAGLFAARIFGQWVMGLFDQSFGRLPFWWDEAFGFQTILYAGALAVFAALIVGLIPALKATGRELQGRLREGASGTSTMKFGGVWTGVIVMQAAITVAFLATVLALGWSTLVKGRGDDVTYARDHLLTARMDLSAGSGGPRDLEQTYRVIANRIRQESGVASVSYTTAVPGTIWERIIYELQPAELHAEAEARALRITDSLWSMGARVREDFFETLGLPLVSGRIFTDAEARLGAPLAVVDETFVRTVLGGRTAIGVMLRERNGETDGRPGPWLEIIGVVNDAELGERNGADDGTVYRVAAAGQPMRLLVRTEGPAAPYTQRVYGAALAADADIRLADLKTLTAVEYDDGLPERIFLRAFSVISAIALLLATAGIYSLISFTLARRTKEIGIRVALGAAPSGIIRAVFARAFTQIGLGVLAGALPGFVILGSVADDTASISLPAGILAILGVCAFVVIIALVSCAVPLRRALTIQPTEALRLS
jgi:predicted permease